MDKKRTRQSIFILTVGCALSLGLALTKLLVGLGCNSICIMLDSINSFFDVGTGLVSIVAFCLLFAQKSERHPHGWGRSEYLAGFVTAAVSVVLGASFLIRSLTRLTMPEPVYYGVRNCILICVAWGVKVGMTFFYFFANKKIQSKAIRALLLDSIADIGVTTVSVVSFAVSSLVSYAVDGWLGIAVSIAIVIFGIRLVLENAHLLLTGDVDDEVAAVQTALSALPQIEVCRVRLHDYGYRNKYGTATVESTLPPVELAEITKETVQNLQEQGIWIEIVYK